MSIKHTEPVSIEEENRELITKIKTIITKYRYGEIKHEVLRELLKDSLKKKRGRKPTPEVKEKEFAIASEMHDHYLKFNSGKIDQNITSFANDLIGKYESMGRTYAPSDIFKIYKKYAERLIVIDSVTERLSVHDKNKKIALKKRTELTMERLIKGESVEDINKDPSISIENILKEIEK